MTSKNAGLYVIPGGIHLTVLIIKGEAYWNPGTGVKVSYFGADSFQ